jgi:hypothetical protein
MMQSCTSMRKRIPHQVQARGINEVCAGEFAHERRNRLVVRRNSVSIAILRTDSKLRGAMSYLKQPRRQKRIEHSSYNAMSDA